MSSYSGDDLMKSMATFDLKSVYHAVSVTATIVAMLVAAQPTVAAILPVTDFFSYDGSYDPASGTPPVGQDTWTVVTTGGLSISPNAPSAGLAEFTDNSISGRIGVNKTYGDAYKVSQLRNDPLSPLEGFYLMTQGAAIAHGLDEEIGNLNPGTIADFIVVEPRFDELTSLRIQQDADFDDVFFALSILGDDRMIEETWISGQCCYSKKNLRHWQRH